MCGLDWVTFVSYYPPLKDGNNFKLSASIGIDEIKNLSWLNYGVFYCKDAVTAMNMDNNKGEFV